MMRSFRKTAVLVSVAALASTLLVAAPANAVYAACGAWREEKDVLGPNVYRAAVTCSRIDSDTKVRAKLVRTAGPDYESDWTTKEYATVHTGYWTCYSGCYATFEVAKR
jgi:hypothetical protein